MTPKYLVVLPALVKEYAQTCIASSKLQEHGRFLLVDNSPPSINLGIMRSHSIASDIREPDEWLIILSAAIKFGTPGGLDFIEHLTTHADHGVVGARGPEGFDIYGWHLMAFRPDVANAMGYWDPNFSPYGYCDIDLSIRIHKRWPDLIWGGYNIDAHDRGMAHSIKIGGLDSPANPLLEYWHRKWGAAPGSEFEEYWHHPFNDPANDLNYFPDYEGCIWNKIGCGTPYTITQEENIMVARA